MLSTDRIVERLTADTGAEIENRINWFAKNRILSASGSAGTYEAVITDIVTEAALTGDVQAAVGALNRRLTCPLCQVDVSLLSRQAADGLRVLYGTGQQFVCLSCLDRLRGPSGGSNSTRVSP